MPPNACLKQWVWIYCSDRHSIFRRPFLNRHKHTVFIRFPGAGCFLQQRQDVGVASGDFIQAAYAEIVGVVGKFVGFVAHEFAEVSPSSVTGSKDAVDADGNPIYQAMQASSAEVMANIVAELQSLRKRIDVLEAA